jgi:hypothetical protein
MMDSEIYPDGGSVEASPSYSHFIARQYVDAFVLMEKNGVSGLDGLRDCIRKQYAWMHRMASPSRRTLQFNDSYALDVDQDIEIVSKLLPLKLPAPRKSFLFRASRAGRIANDRFQVYFDAMPQMNLWHDHHGRPNLLIYCEGAPLMVDSGCPNYDHFLRETYMTRSCAHNVLHVHEKPEHSFGEHWRQPLPEVAVTEFSPGRDRSQAVFTHRFRWAERRLDYTWTRTVFLEKASVGIRDHVESRNAITATLRFHFAPLNMMLSEDRRKATIFFQGRDIRFEQTRGTTAGPLDLRYKPAYDQWNRMTYTPCLKCTGRGTVMDCNVRVVL